MSTFGYVPVPERIGELGKAWATRCAGGWKVFVLHVGVILEQATYEQAVVALRQHGVGHEGMKWF